MAEEKLKLILQEIVRRANDNSRRIRTIEQRIEGMENKIQAVEDSFLKHKNNFNTKLVSTEAFIRNINEELVKLTTSIEHINRKLERTASKREVEEIEKMFELLSPIKQEFVTQDSLEDEVHEEIENYIEKEKERIRTEKALQKAREMK